MNEVKASIIVPAYNVERYLSECIDSLLKQTYKNIEIIIIDDGSTDRTGEIADEYQRKSDKVRVFHQKNGGISKSRNTGIEHVTGDVVFFVDSDDCVVEKYVEKLLNTMERDKAEIAMCSFYHLFQNERPEDTKMLKVERIFNPAEYLEIFYRYSGSYSLLWNKAYKRSVLENLRFPEGVINEDARLMPDIILGAEKISYIPEPLYYYRRRRSSTMGGNKEKLTLSDMSWLSEHMDKYRMNGQTRLFCLAQKLYISKIVENLQYMQGDTRKEVKKKLKIAMKEFLKSKEFGLMIKMKYIYASTFPDVYGKQFMKGKDTDKIYFE